MLPIALPDWMPWWVELVLLVIAVLVAVAFAAMPFSVFGVKSRLDALDERLDELRSDLRALTNRLPDPEMRDPAMLRRGAPDRDVGVAIRGRAAPPPPREPAVARQRDADPRDDDAHDPDFSRAPAPVPRSPAPVPRAPAPVLRAPIGRPPIPPPPVLPDRTGLRTEPRLRFPGA